MRVRGLGIVMMMPAMAVLLPVTGTGMERVQFNRDVRPLLAANCLDCHGQDGAKRRADLRLDEEEGAHAKAIRAGDPGASPLVQRILTEDLEERMPPPDSHRRLTEEEKALLVRWVEEGGAYENHWAFVAPERPDLPTADEDEWARTPIDRFILSGLEEVAMTPAAESDRATLVRRLAIDLTGLPPEAEDLSGLLADWGPGSYEALVDRLLASPRYGERMALPWLDAARYADSNGFQQDGDTWQWMWRDWVVDALNENLPFDDFTTWQLAGDLLPDATVEQRIASGFNRNHMLNGEGGAIPEEQRFVILFDRVDTTATTWMGLTMACAQCHDHKYDPITQKDYYRFLDAFNRVPETGTPQRQSARIRVAEPYLELPTEENRERLAAFEDRIVELQGRLEKEREKRYAVWLAEVSSEKGGEDGLAGEACAKPGQPRDPQDATASAQTFEKDIWPEMQKGIPEWEELEAVRRERDAYRGDQIPRPMVMSDGEPRETRVLDRGAYLSPLEPVGFAPPSFLPALPEEAPSDRLGLARWLAMAENPLTARVQVNRMWQHFFGTGLVKTSEDFGMQSAYPVLGDLLDWLAVRFREDGWNVKGMHRLLVTSAAYRQSSRVTAEQLEKDPENRYFGRGARFRMPAMVLRDWALAAAGLLEERVGGAPVYPYQPENVWEPLAITKERDFTYPLSSGGDLYRRSLYTFWRRTVSPANMFDASSRQACRVRQSTNNTPLHALTTMNDPTWVEAARVLAERVMEEERGLEGQLALAFTRVLCRAPSGSEGRWLQEAYSKQLRLFESAPQDAEAFLSVGRAGSVSTVEPWRRAALAAVCLGLFNLDEALTRE